MLLTLQGHTKWQAQTKIQGQEIFSHLYGSHILQL